MDGDPHASHADDPGTVRADTDGVIRHWGDDVEAVLGYSAAQAIGQRVDLVIPPALHRLHWRGFDKAMSTGKMRRPGATVKVPAVHRDGSIVALRAELNLVRATDGTVEGAAASNLRSDPAWVAAGWKPVLAVVGAVTRLRR